MTDHGVRHPTRRPAAPRKPDSSSTYRLICRCGAEITGQRAATYQTVSCERCGATRFILPRNPRPRPTASTATTEPETSRSQPASSTPHRRRRRSPRRPPPWPLIAGTLALIAVVALATWVWRSRQAERAQVDLAIGLREGRAALHDVDFETALGHLATADRAARRLGDDTVDARTARHLYREAEVWSSQVNFSLYDLAEELEDVREDQAATAQASFGRRFAGRTIVVDALVTRLPREHEAADDPSKLGGIEPSQLAFQVEWLVQSEDVTLELAIREHSALDWLEPDRPTRVIFGAELADLLPDVAKSSRWHIELVPGSCVLLTTVEPLAYAHWPVDDELGAVLARQAKQLGVEP